MNDDEIVKMLRTMATYDCGYEEESDAAMAAIDIIESLQAQLSASRRREKEDAELIRKIYFATDEDLCDCCRKIVRMIEAWWNDDEEGEAE